MPVNWSTIDPLPSASPITGQPVPSHYIHSSGIHFQDTSGRSLLLRGVNLSGAAKNPSSHPQQRGDDFFESAERGEGLSWVNQPLNLDDGSGDVHLARLRAWGWNCLRFVFTWEAIEHAGPGKYDQEYIQYVVRVLRRCGDYGFKVYMDPHQDVWSRFSGGSGAPIWTLHACNLQPRNFPSTYASLLQPFYVDPTSPPGTKPDSAKFPAMIWSTNYERLANLTVWTLFFGGRVFAPKCVIDGKNIQDWLQEKYLGAVEAMVKGVVAADRQGGGDLLEKVVIGWDSYNEVSPGLIGLSSLDKVDNTQGKMHKGPTVSVLDNLKLGMGEKVLGAEYWVVGALGPKKQGNVDLDPGGVKAWMGEEEDRKWARRWGYERSSEWTAGECIWSQHGIWDSRSGKLLKPNYFSKSKFDSEFWAPHFISFSSMIRSHHPEAILFIQPGVFHVPPALPSSTLKNRACYAPHFYDGLTLITRHWWWFGAEPVGLVRGQYATLVQALGIGEPSVRGCLRSALKQLKGDVKQFGEENKCPVLIGEIGIPYDLDDRKAYGYCEGGRGQGDYTNQQRALDASLGATDNDNIINWTMWTYVPDNTHEFGDQWNMEDLSIWSADDLVGGQVATTNPEKTLNSGSTSQSSFQTYSDGSTPRNTTEASLSSTTTRSMYSRLQGRVTPEAIASGDDIPAELILDGARAVGAFCRPYPVATKGIPANIHFEIRTGHFKFTAELDSRYKSGEPTIIYVPFVHFAADFKAMSVDVAGLRERSGPVQAKVKSDAKKAVSDGSDQGLKLDIDVELSEGRYEVDGQYLKWYYDAPEQGVKTVTIDIRRNGGPIPARVEQSIPSWGDLCPAGCSIM